MNLRKAFRSIAVFALVFWTSNCAILFVFQRNLLFAQPRNLAEPAAYGLKDVEARQIAGADGTKVTVWHWQARPGAPTLVFFPGNGETIGDRTDFLARLADRGFGVMALSYRGYGNSEGSPSEQGFYTDARAALLDLRDRGGTDMKKMVLFGESLGTGVATQMATEFPVAALVLKSPYTSITDIASSRAPWAPIGLMIRDPFESGAKIGRIGKPLLVLHGENDDTVPVRFGRALFAAAAEPKQAIWYPGVGHMDFDEAAVADALVAFCRAYGLMSGDPPHSAAGVRSQRASWAG